MSSCISDPALDFALKCVSAVQSTYGAEGEVQKKFRSRCRHLIESLYYSGLAYTLAYVVSKAGSSALNFVLEAPVPEEIAKHVKQVKEAEEASYALYGAFLLAFLKQTGIPEVAGAKMILDVLGNLNRSVTLAIAEIKALRFAEWLKRLAEGLFEAK